MDELTTEQAADLARQYGLDWMTPELLEQLRGAASRARAAGFAVPRMRSEFCEPAHIFAGPD